MRVSPDGGSAGAGGQPLRMSCEHDDGLDWQGYLTTRVHFADFAPNKLILDIGCGGGTHVCRLRERRCRAVGLDTNQAAITQCQTRGLPVLQATAEEIPLKSAAVDGVVCNVVLPYTDERRTIREIGRVLKDAGVGYCCYHGVGYYLRYLLVGTSWKSRFYGLRTLINTWLYSVTGMCLPGFLGDTLYQSRRRLAGYYRESNLRIRQTHRSRTFLGCPVFIYHTIQKGRS